MDGNIPVGNTCMFHAIFKIFSGWLTTAECRTLLKNILVRAAEILLKYLKKPSKAWYSGIYVLNHGMVTALFLEVYSNFIELESRLYIMWLIFCRLSGWVYGWVIKTGYPNRRTFLNLFLSWICSGGSRVIFQIL